MAEAGRGDTGDVGDKAAAGYEHFQSAARELIAAFRSVLDAAEELVEDPEAVKQTVSAFGAVARDAARQVAGFAAGAAGAGGGGAPSEPVEHIDLDDADPADAAAGS